MIKLQNINLSYRKKIFERMNLEITTPGIYGIIGESGIGKSTILNIIYGLEQNYEGKYFFGNCDVSNSNKIQNYYGKEIALIHQDYKLINRLSAYDNILLAMYNKNDSHKIYELATKLNIDKTILHKQVKYLSGGEKQRIAILRGIINNPKVLLFDEPTSGLDKVNRQNFIDLLTKLEDQNMIIIIVSHDFVLRNHIDNIFEIYDYKLHLTKGQNINSEILEVSDKKNTKLLHFLVKNFKTTKVMSLLFICISVVTIFIALMFLTPLNNILSEYYTYSSNTFQETDLIISSNEGITSEQITKLETIDGVESVEPYNLITPYSRATNYDVVTNEAITVDNSDNFYLIDQIDTLTYLKVSSEAMMINLVAEGVNTVEDNFVYIEGSKPIKSNEVAIGETFAQVLMYEQNWENIIGQTLPLTCENVTTKEKYECNKTITGVVKEYSYEEPYKINSYNGEYWQTTIYVNEPSSLYTKDNSTFSSANINLTSDANYEEVVNELTTSGVIVEQNSQTYSSESTYREVFSQAFDIVIIYFCLIIVFIFLATYAFLMQHKRDYAIYFINGYSKKQILINSIVEMILLYTVSFISAASLIILCERITITITGLIISYFICWIFFILPIIYLVLALRKKQINKYLK